MTVRCGAVGLVVLLLAGGLYAANDKSKDEDKLQGEWTVVSEDIGGKAVSADKLPKATLIVKRNLWLKPLFGNDKRRVQFSFKLHADKKPKQIDLLGAGTTWPGIYSLSGDTLIVCEAKQSLDQGGKRPTELKAGEDVWLTVFTRKEKK